jgi:hypothetical protein
MTEIKDYAAPAMAAEKALKDLHTAMLTKDYMKASFAGLAAMRALNETLMAIVDMQQNDPWEQVNASRPINHQ